MRSMEPNACARARDARGPTCRMDKAEQLGIRVLDEDGFRQLLDGGPAALGDGGNEEATVPATAGEDTVGENTVEENA